MKPKILFLSHRPPWPPDRGDKIRSYHLLERLSRIADVHLACFADDAADRAHAEALRPMLAGLHVEQRVRSRAAGLASALATGRPLSVTLFASRTLQDFVAETLEHQQIAAIFVFSGQMAQFVPEEIGRTRFVMDFVDVDSAKFESYAEQTFGPMAWLYRREARTLGSFEKVVAQRAHASLFVSEAEAALFRQRSGLDESVIALENGTAFDASNAIEAVPLDGEGPLIVFTGQMDYPPNIDAVTGFARNTLPLIRATAPHARFAIVGRSPGPQVRALESLAGVTVTGEVPDVRGWLLAADVVVAPLRIARGVQNKVLEAMAMGRPVVASSAAFAGIAARAGTELVVADGAEDEAREILRLLGDPQRAQAIGQAAKARITEYYGWETRLAALPAIIGLPASPAREAAE